MKKQIFSSLVVIVAILLLASCQNYQPKAVALNNQVDSLNYTLGLSNGEGIKNYYMNNDSTGKSLESFIKALDKAYKSGADKNEMYELGVQIGKSFKQQQKAGLMGDSALVFNVQLVKQGMINAIENFDQGMTAQDAETFLQTTMMRLQQEKMGNANPAPQIEMPEELQVEEIEIEK